MGMQLYIDVKLVEREPLYVLCKKGMASTAGFEERYAGLYRKAFQKRLQVIGAPVAIYHNEHFDGQPSDIEIGLPVGGVAEGVKKLPGGTYCCAVHNGPYGTLPITYALAGMWIAQNDYRVCGTPYDLYVRGGNDKILDPEQYVTEIFIPVAREEPMDDFDFGDLGSIEDLLGPPPENS